jgi:hypothetical protein
VIRQADSCGTATFLGGFLEPAKKMEDDSSIEGFPSSTLSPNHLSSEAAEPPGVHFGLLYACSLSFSN